MQQNNRKNRIFSITKIFNLLKRTSFPVVLPPNADVLLIHRQGFEGFYGLLGAISSLKTMQTVRISCIIDPKCMLLAAAFTEVNWLTSFPVDGISKFHTIIDFYEDLTTLKLALKHNHNWIFSGKFRKQLEKQERFVPSMAIVNAMMAACFPLEHKQHQALSVQIHAAEKQQIQLFLQRNVIGDFVIIHATANHHLMRWHIAGFIKLIEILRKRYQYDFVFVGVDAKEQHQIRLITRALGFETFFYELNQPRHLFALAQVAKLYIGHESEHTHLLASTALVPVLALYGPGTFYTSWPNAAHMRVLQKLLPCNPCNAQTCVLPQNPCMNQLALAEIIAAIQDLVQLPN